MKNKKLLPIIVILLIVLALILFPSKGTLQPETDLESSAEVVPTDPIEYIYYSFGEETEVYSCNQPIAIDEEDIVDIDYELPFYIDKAYVEIVFGVLDDKMVGQRADLYVPDDVAPLTISNYLKNPTGANDVLQYMFSNPGLIPEDEYNPDNVVKYDDWQACVSQI